MKEKTTVPNAKILLPNSFFSPSLRHYSLFAAGDNDIICIILQRLFPFMNCPLKSEHVLRSVTLIHVVVINRVLIQLWNIDKNERQNTNSLQSLPTDWHIVLYTRQPIDHFQSFDRTRVSFGNVDHGNMAYSFFFFISFFIWLSSIIFHKNFIRYSLYFRRFWNEISFTSADYDIFHFQSSRISASNLF